MYTVAASLTLHTFTTTQKELKTIFPSERRFYDDFNVYIILRINHKTLLKSRKHRICCKLKRNPNSVTYSKLNMSLTLSESEPKKQEKIEEYEEEDFHEDDELEITDSDDSENEDETPQTTNAYKTSFSATALKKGNTELSFAEAKLYGLLDEHGKIKKKTSKSKTQKNPNEVSIVFFRFKFVTLNLNRSKSTSTDCQKQRGNRNLILEKTLRLLNVLLRLENRRKPSER